MPEPPGRRGGPRALPGRGDRLRRARSAGSARASSRRLYVASDAIDPWIDEDQAQALRAKVEFLVVQDTTVTPLAQLADVVLAGRDLRREGGLLRQRRRPAPVRRGGLAAARRLAARPRPVRDPARTGRGGPVRSSEVLAELAGAVPAFAVAEGGKLPAFGVVLGQTPAPRPSAACRRASPTPGSSPMGAVAWRVRCVIRTIDAVARLSASSSRRQPAEEGSSSCWLLIGILIKILIVVSVHPGRGRVPDPRRAEGRGLRAGPDRAEPRRARVRHPVRPAPAAGRRGQDAPEGGRDPRLRQQAALHPGPDDRDRRGDDRLRRRAVRPGRARRPTLGDRSTSRSRRASTSASSTSSRSAAWRSTA